MLTESCVMAETNPQRCTGYTRGGYGEHQKQAERSVASSVGAAFGGWTCG